MAIKQRLPSEAEALEMLCLLITRNAQVEQLRFMRETQGEAFAMRVKERLIAAGKVRKK